MAKRDGDRPQLDFPQLIADLIDTLQIRGPVGLLDFSDIVSPVFIVGARGLEVTAEQPVFTSAEMIDGFLVSPVSNSVVWTTGGLLAGVYDIFASISASGVSLTQRQLRIEHRNVASVKLRTILSVATSGTEQSVSANLPLIGYSIAVGDSFLLISPAAGTFSGTVAGTMGFRRRTVP